MKDQDTLPGDRSKTYIKASGAAVLLLGPVLGLIYAVFLPFIGIAMAISFVGAKVIRAAERAFRGKVHETGKALTFGWKPLHAYLASRRKVKNGQ